MIDSAAKTGPAATTAVLRRGGTVEVLAAALAAGAAIIGWIIGAPLLRQWRLARVGAGAFPHEWGAILHERVPLYRRLPKDLREQLQRLVLVFLSDKTFVGAGGFVITDEVRLIVAAQACLLLLNRPTTMFPLFRTIVIYPSTFAVDHREEDEAGIVVEELQERAGEAWERGPVILSWDDVEYGADNFDDGGNVVLHEFAHQLDFEIGGGDGAPVHGAEVDAQKWAHVFQREYDRLLDDIEGGRDTVLNPYGATEPAEFFAVATETFFERPRELERGHAELYAALRGYYGVDPARWEESR